MQAVNLTILGRGIQALAPASPGDLVRLQDLQTSISGTAPLYHTHVSANITDLDATLLAWAVANGVVSSGVVSSGTGTVALLTNGGLRAVGGLLGIDSGVVSLVGHVHASAAITDFEGAVLALLVENGVSLSGTGTMSLLANGGLQYVGSSLAVNSGMVSLVGHTHTSSAITDFDAAMSAWAAVNGVALSGTGTVALLNNGGLTYLNGGLAVNSDIVSFVGHHHVSTDIEDLPTALGNLLEAALGDSNTVMVSGTNPFALEVVRAPSGGLLATAAGLEVDLGTAHTQAAYGDHTHLLLHNPVTLGPMSSLSGTLATQQLSLELVPVPGGGILVTPSGVQVDWSKVQAAGVATTTVALAVANTPTVQLGYSNGVLSGTIPLDANPPGGTGGQIVAGANGLRVVLGTTSIVAAAGNHTHAVATTTSDGFIAASDLALLYELADAGTPSGIQPVDTTTLTLGLDGGGHLSGTVQYNTNPIYGQGALGANANGLYVVLGTAPNVAALGNHLHDSRYLQLTGGTLSGALTLAANPTASLQAATKQYVDSATVGIAAGYLPLTGGTLTGNLILAGAPSSTLQAATKGYVDTSVANCLPLTGGSLTGNLMLAADPTLSLQAATKEYVDNILSTTLAVQSAIAAASDASADPPTAADFNGLVTVVNNILTLLQTLGLPS